LPSRHGPHSTTIYQGPAAATKSPKYPPCELDEITAGWQRVKEATSSSPSGLHFRHYRAGTFNPIITVFNAHLANIGFTSGYSLK